MTTLAEFGFDFGAPPTECPVVSSEEPQATLTTQTPKKTRAEMKSDKEFNRIIWAISGPIITWPGYTDMPIPEQIRSQITFQRMALAMKREEFASEAECLWYLSTASLIAPMDHDWAQVFFYLSRKHMLNIGTNPEELPEFLKDQIVLEQYTEEHQLYELRRWLYKKSIEGMR